MNKELILSNLRTIPDFPKPGIIFFDVTTLFKNPACVRDLVDSIAALYAGKGITKVVGLESRGFILGSLIADRLGAGFIPARKPGKLPADVVSMEYAKEYGTDRLEIHKDAIDSNDVVLVHDDILATGGTANAAIELVRAMGAKNVYTNFILEIADLPGRAALPADVEVETMLSLSECDFR